MKHGLPITNILYRSHSPDSQTCNFTDWPFDMIFNLFNDALLPGWLPTSRFDCLIEQSSAFIASGRKRAILWRPGVTGSSSKPTLHHVWSACYAGRRRYIAEGLTDSDWIVCGRVTARAHASLPIKFKLPRGFFLVLTVTAMLAAGRHRRHVGRPVTIAAPVEKLKCTHCQPLLNCKSRGARVLQRARGYEMMLSLLTVHLIIAHLQPFCA